MAGAPKGNRNGVKENRLWGDTLKRAVAQQDSKRLRAIAEKLLSKAEEGDIQAIKELGDRLDGKSVQPINADIKGDVTVQIVRFTDSAS